MINDILVPGLTFGSLYALVAVSFNILYRPTNVLNFAQGDLIMVGAMLVAATALGGLPWILAVLLAALGVGLVALVEERVAVAPVLRRSQHAAGWVITTLAFSLIVSQVAGKVWSDEPRTITPPLGLSLRSSDVLGVQISSYATFIIVATIAIVVAAEMFSRTRSGRAIRALASDREAARLRGIDPERFGQASFVAGGMLAGLIGVLAAPLLVASVTMGFVLLIKGFFAAVVGGIGDHRGALVAGWVVGLVEAIGANYASPGVRTAALFAVVLTLLMVRPAGIFNSGKAVRRV